MTDDRAKAADGLREAVHSHGIVAFCGTDAVCRCDFRWRSVADYEVHLTDALRAYAEQRAAEELRAIVLDAQIVAEVMHQSGPVRVPITYLTERAAALSAAHTEEPGQ